MMRRALVGVLLLGSVWAKQEFQAGSSAVDISPPAYPVRVNGMFAERSATRVLDPLFARSVALDDGETKIIFCVVDTCMVPRELIDKAKEEVHRKTGLSTARMMVSATHTHSAPAAMGCLGSRMDPDYARWLPGKIAECMIAALNGLEPARIGWASIDDWEHTHNRRWIFRLDRTGTDPFGVRNIHANMHPGHLSSNVIGPSGPVDPELSLFAVQTPRGPLRGHDLAGHERRPDVDGLRCCARKTDHGSVFGRGRPICHARLSCNPVARSSAPRDG